MLSQSEPDPPLTKKGRIPVGKADPELSEGRWREGIYYFFYGGEAFPEIKIQAKREIEKKMPVVALGCAVMVIFGSAVGKRMTDQSKEKGKIIQADAAREQEGATLENFGYTEKLEEVVWKNFRAGANNRWPGTCVRNLFKGEW